MERLDAGAPWPGPLVWYGFLAGVAAGSYALGALAGVFGGEADRRATRPARLLAFPLVAVCVGLLAAEAAREGRVWHRLGTAGVSALAALGVAGFGTFVGALAEEGWDRPAGLGRRLARLDRSPAGRALAVAGTAAALAVAATTRPLPPSDWAGAGCLGAVLLASAAATGPSAAVVLARCRRRDPDDDPDDPAVARLAAAAAVAAVAELAALTALALSLRGPSGLAFQRWPGRMIPLFVVPVGLVLPLILRQVRGPRGAIDAAWLVLLGGLVLRAAVAGIPESLVSILP